MHVMQIRPCRFTHFETQFRRLGAKGSLIGTRGLREVSRLVGFQSHRLAWCCFRKADTKSVPGSRVFLLRRVYSVGLSYNLVVSPGGLSLWLVLWLVACHCAPGRACPRLCVCYHMPMTVSCQSQNFTSVPAGVPYDSQRVFLQNNRITELRADSFGFETQASRTAQSMKYSAYFL